MDTKEALLNLVGKIVKFESKKPAGDLIERTLEVTAAVAMPDSDGVLQNYLFGVTPDGYVGLTAMRYVYADSVVASDSPNFKAQSLDGWFCVPPAKTEGKFGLEDHSKWAEKWSAKAQKRLPASALKVADYVLKA